MFDTLRQAPEKVEEKEWPMAVFFWHLPPPAPAFLVLVAVQLPVLGWPLAPRPVFRFLAAVLLLVLCELPLRRPVVPVLVAGLLLVLCVRLLSVVRGV